MQRKNQMDYTVVVPVYNGEKTIEELYLRISRCLKKISKNYEVILVDDYSQDKSWEIMNVLYKKYKKLKIIRLTQNFGQHNATLCGMFKAQGNIIITIDDDLQHKPEDIPLLIAKINEGYDVVIAYFKKKEHSFFKKTTSKFMNYLNNILIGKPKDIYLSSFRAFKREIIEDMKKIKTTYPFIPALIFTITKNVTNVILSHYKSKKGATTYSFKKYVKLASNLFINNSLLLLKVTGFIGIISFVISFMIIFFLILKKILYNTAIIGWTSLIVSVYLLGGLILYSLGVSGEYLLRIINETTQKPFYFIKEKRF